MYVHVCTACNRTKLLRISIVCPTDTIYMYVYCILRASEISVERATLSLHYISKLIFYFLFHMLSQSEYTICVQPYSYSFYSNLTHH